MHSSLNTSLCVPLGASYKAPGVQWLPLTTWNFKYPRCKCLPQCGHFPPQFYNVFILNSVLNSRDCWGKANLSHHKNTQAMSSVLTCDSYIWPLLLSTSSNKTSWYKGLSRKVLIGVTKIRITKRGKWWQASRLPSLLWDARGSSHKSWGTAEEEEHSLSGEERGKSCLFYVSIFNNSSSKDTALKIPPRPTWPEAEDGGLISLCHKLPKMMLQFKKICIAKFNLTYVHSIFSYATLFSYCKHKFSNK